MKKDTIALLMRNFRYHAFGTCTVCGKASFFFCRNPENARDLMWCLFCGSSSRKRHVAKLLLEYLGSPSRSVAGLAGKLDKSILNTDSSDQFSKFLLPGSPTYFCSEFHDDIPPGTQLRERTFCQDIQRLTFEDRSFDVVITEEVLEHIRDYRRAFSEIYRVLKPQGRHIFTVPFFFDRPTLVRVDTSGAEDIHLLPPEYHGDAVRGKILAYRTYGIDLFDELRSLGFSTSLSFAGHRDQRFGIFDTAVLVSTKTA